VVIEKLNKLTLSYSVLIQEHPGRRLLDFGGGTGVFCEIAHELGRYVTYLDIPGLVSEFARWRFWEYQLPIGVQIASPENPAIVGSTTSLLRRGSRALARKKQILVVDDMCRAVLNGSLLILYLSDLSSRANPTHS
jgi:hypothetical protein